MSWLLRLFQHLSIGWSLSRSSPIHYHTPDSHHHPSHQHCPGKCAPPVHRAGGPDLSSLSLQPMQLQAFSSHPPPAKGAVKKKTSMAWGGKRVMKGWRGSFCTGLPQPAEPPTGIRAAPATSWTSLCTGGLRPAQRHGQGGPGSPWVDVQGATLSTLYPESPGYALLLPHPGPQTPRHNCCHPQTPRGRLGCGPQISLALFSLSLAGEEVARQEKGDMQVASQSGGTPLYHPGATARPTHRSQILPPHLPPPG